MITKETALSHAKELMEYLSTQELYEICACTDSLQVIRTQYVLERRDSVMQVEQIDARLALLDKEKEAVLKDKEVVVAQALIVAEEKSKREEEVVAEEAPVVE